jgi:hypothetical protein
MRPIDAARGAANAKEAGPAAMKIAVLDLGQSPSILGGSCRRALSSVVDLVVPPLTNGPSFSTECVASYFLGG